MPIDEKIILQRAIFRRRQRQDASKVVDDAFEEYIRKQISDSVKKIAEENEEKEKQQKDGKKDDLPQNFAEVLDRMVAEAITGGKHTSGVLRALFGLVPNLIGR